MTSNALSTRRKFLRRPKVCKTLPNPGRCEPPPPPEPEPPDWPPDEVLLHWIASWKGGALDVEMLLTRVEEQWWWLHPETIAPIDYRASWKPDPETHLAELILLFIFKGGAASCAKEDIPVLWGVETLYVITEWDVLIPGELSSQATFLF